MKRIVIYIGVLVYWAAAADLTKIQEKVEAAKNAVAARHYEGAAMACAEALQIDAGNSDALGCATAAGLKLDEAVKIAVAALGNGHFDDAKKWCTAVITLDPTNANQNTQQCKSVNDRIVAHQNADLAVVAAEAKVNGKNFTGAASDLEKVDKQFPDIVERIIKLNRRIETAHQPSEVQLANAYLQLRLPSPADAKTFVDKAKQKCLDTITTDPANVVAIQCVNDASASLRIAAKSDAWTTIDKAKAQRAGGDMDGAISTLKALLTGPLDADVRTSGQQALEETNQIKQRAQNSRVPAFVDALRSTWIAQFLAALVIISALWIVPHVLRWLWRKALRKFNRSKHPHYAFTGVQDNGNLGAVDAMLDALQRAPAEVRQKIWTPTRLLLNHGTAGYEVWENFAIDDPLRELRESAKGLEVSNGRLADNALANAFETLQFNVGTVGLNVATKFWHALLDWWHDGEPAVSGVAQEMATADGLGKQVMIRLTCSGGPKGTVSVLASTLRDTTGADTVALTAARVAYKLLSRLSDEPELVELIDGHAGFRQGAKLLSCYVRSINDAQADQQARTSDLTKAVHNLEFARQVFCRDEKHQVYYLQSLRFEAVCYALLGREDAALTRFEELEDKSAQGPDEWKAFLSTEAIYNQGVIRLAQASAAADPSTAGLLARRLFDAIPKEVDGMKQQDAAMSQAAAAGVVAVLALIPRVTWPTLDESRWKEPIESAAKVIEVFDKAAGRRSGDDRRAYSTLTIRTRRDAAVAKLRSLAAFTAPNRGPFESDGEPLKPEVLKEVDDMAREALALLECADPFGPTSLNGLVSRGYALLLRKQWRAAENCAIQVIAKDKTCEFAYYIAGEACKQRSDMAQAQLWMKTFKDSGNTISDPALSRLDAALAGRAAKA